MSVKQILTVLDPVLRQISVPVDTVDDEIRALMQDMLESMYSVDGIGLAAIQIGVPKRVIVMDLSNREVEENINASFEKPRFFINPEIIDVSEEMYEFSEGCLSVPGHYADVSRPKECRVKFLDYDGKEQILDCEDMLAICIQHEIDHLEGIVFLDHISRLKRDVILRKLRKSLRN